MACLPKKCDVNPDVRVQATQQGSQLVNKGEQDL